MMTDSADNSVAPVPRRGIWLWTLLAILIATILAGAAGVLAGDEVTSAQDYRTHGSGWTDTFELLFALAVCAAAVFVTWIAFYITVFRRRAGIWKSLVALLVMLLVVTLIAVPVRVGTFLTYWSADEDMLHDMRKDLNKQLLAIRAKLGDETGELRVDRGLPRMRSLADMQAALKSIQEERGHLRSYQAEVEKLLQATKQKIMAADVYEAKRQDALERIEKLQTPNSQWRKLYALESDLFDRQEEALNYLMDHRDDWRFHGDTIEFRDPVTLKRFDDLMRATYEIIPQIDNIEGAGGGGVQAAVPKDDVP